MNRSPSASLAAAGAERLSLLSLLLGAMLLLISFLLIVEPACAQTPKPGDQTPLPVDKTKVQPKNPESKPEPVKPAPTPSPSPSPPMDKFKLPPGTIGLVFDGIKEGLANLQPDMIFMTPKKFKELLDEIETLKKQLKPERQSVHSCKLTGKLEDNGILLKAEIAFATDQPRTVVPLAFKGAYLVNEGNLDQQNLTLAGNADEGYVIQANRADKYSLTLNLKVGLRRGSAGGGGERGFELDLPGAAVTTLSLDLPANIKEIRWNDLLEKAKSPGHWEKLSVGTAKTLDVSWKEQTVQPGTGPLLTSEAQIKVKLEETSTLVDAELTLEDLRGQAKEWQLLVPEKAKVELIKPPANLASDVQAGAVDGNKNQIHFIRFVEPTAERFTVSVQMRIPRPATGNIPRLSVGPFLVLNAFSQKGTIVVQAPPASVRGQRLIFHRTGDVNQHDIGKGPSQADTAAKFDYWIPRGPTPSRAPLEIEWRAEKGLVETSVEHQLKLRRGANGLQIESLTQIKVKSLSAGVDFLDVQLPRYHLAHTGFFSWSPVGGFPGGIAWGGLLENVPHELAFAQPTTDFFCQDDTMELSLPDAQGKARIKFLRPPTGKEFLVTLEGKYQVPGPSHRLRIELPRPLGILDRGGKATVSGDEQIELLDGPASAEEPVPMGQVVTTSLDPTTNMVEFAWRPYRSQLPAHNLIDVTLHGKSVHLRQQITLPGLNRLPRVTKGSGHIRLRVPKTVLNLKVNGGESSIIKDGEQESVWVKPAPAFFEGKPLIVEFDQALPMNQDTAHVWKVPLIWPADSVHLEARVRVWTDPGVMPQPADLSDQWQDLPSEIVEDHDSLPVLVLQGVGKDLALALRLPPMTASNLPLFLCDRGLIEVFVNDAGNHVYNARYVLTKLNGDSLEVEFPVLLDSCLPQITISQWMGPSVKKLNVPFEKERRIARLKVDPSIFRDNMLLEIKYTVPASLTEGRSWQTQVTGPVLKGGSFQGLLRWSVTLPSNWISIVSARNIQHDVHWTLQGGLLTPEPDVQAGELEKWLLGVDAADPGTVVSEAFGTTSQEPILIVHFVKQTWLLLCSGLLVLVSLVLYLVPMGRTLFWVIVVGLGLTLVVAGFIWPTWAPALLYGSQLGVVVLLLGLGVEWLRHERYRRQIVFMPGFTRVKAGSSLLKTSGSGPRQREPSTVDAPVASGLPARGSSIKGQIGKEPE